MQSGCPTSACSRARELCAPDAYGLEAAGGVDTKSCPRCDPSFWWRGFRAAPPVGLALSLRVPRTGARCCFRCLTLFATRTVARPSTPRRPQGDGMARGARGRTEPPSREPARQSPPSRSGILSDRVTVWMGSAVRHSSRRSHAPGRRSRPRAGGSRPPHSPAGDLRQPVGQWERRPGWLAVERLWPRAPRQADGAVACGVLPARPRRAAG